jgi:hypothetical protein
MEKFTDNLDLILLRMRAGETFRSSLKGLDISNSLDNPKTIGLWNKLIYDIDSGKIKAFPGITALHEYVQTQVEITTLLNDKIRMPKAQAYTGFGLGVLGCVFSPLFVPDILQPSATHIIASLLWASLGLGISLFLISKTQKSFWFCDWFFFLKKLLVRINTGETLRSSVLFSLKEEISNPRYPKNLILILSSFLNEVESLEDTPTPELDTKEKTENIDLVKAHIQFLKEALLQASPVTATLEFACSRMALKIPYQIKAKAEILSFWLFLPLFFFQLPAVLGLWVWPFLKHLNQALKSM